MAEIENVPFCVDESPYCVWDDAIASKNRQFIRGMAPDYFAYIAEGAGEKLEHPQYGRLAATHLRATYLHALETVVAVTFVALQAPSCIFGWLGKYRIENLRALVEKTQIGSEILNRHGIVDFSWERIADRFFIVPPSSTTDDGIEIDRELVVLGFAESLSLMVADFMEEESASEHNAVKHGFRISAGGFSLGYRRETVPGVEDPTQPMVTLGASEHGTSGYALNPINGSKTHFGVTMEARNWNAPSLVARLRIISCWLGVVKAALRHWIRDSSPPPDFSCPLDRDAYSRPWALRSPVSNFKMTTITLKRTPHYSGGDILRTYRMAARDQSS
jgi:hypothetical protein